MVAGRPSSCFPSHRTRYAPHLSRVPASDPGASPSSAGIATTCTSTLKILRLTVGTCPLLHTSGRMENGIVVEPVTESGIASPSSTRTAVVPVRRQHRGCPQRERQRKRRPRHANHGHSCSDKGIGTLGPPGKRLDANCCHCKTCGPRTRGVKHRCASPWPGHRSRRPSPSRWVIPLRSAHSRSGIRNLRDSPVRSRSSPGVISPGATHLPQHAGKLLQRLGRQVRPGSTRTQVPSERRLLAARAPATAQAQPFRQLRQRGVPPGPPPASPTSSRCWSASLARAPAGTPAPPPLPPAPEAACLRPRPASAAAATASGTRSECRSVSTDIPASCGSRSMERRHLAAPAAPQAAPPAPAHQQPPAGVSVGRVPHQRFALRRAAARAAPAAGAARRRGGAARPAPRAAPPDHSRRGPPAHGAGSPGNGSMIRPPPITGIGL